MDMKTKFYYSLLLFFIFNLSLFGSVVHPPLVKDRENFEDIEKFIMGSGHSSDVSSVAFSPDGKMAISGSWDDTVKLWDVKKKVLLHTFEGHSRMVYSVVFSPDGRMIISGSYDDSVKLWDVQTRELLHTFEGHSSDVSSVAFSPDGQKIISGSDDKTVKLWDVQKRELLHTFEGHSSNVSSVAFSPDGQKIISGSSDKSIKLWDIQTKELLHTFEGNSSFISSIAFSPDGQKIISGSSDKSIKLWDIQTKELLHTFEGHSSSVHAVAFSPNSKMILSTSWDDNTIKLWDVQKRELLHTFEGHSSDVSSVAFSPDGQTIMSGSSDKSIKLWNLQKRKLLHTFEGHNNDVVNSVAYSPDAQKIISGLNDNSIKLWDVQKKELLYTFKGHSGSVESVVFSSDGKKIISGSEDKSIKLWDVEKKELLHTFEGHSNTIRSVAFSPDSKKIISGSRDETIKLWDVEKKELLHTFGEHHSDVFSVVFSPDGKKIISGLNDNSIKLWDVQTRKLLYTFEGHSSYVRSVAFSPDGKKIVSGSNDKSIKLWNVQTRELLHTFEGHSNFVEVVAFSPDGKTIISGSDYDSIRLWDVQKKELLYTFEEHSKGLNSLAFSPNGKMILSDSKNNSVKLWDVKKRKVIEEIYMISSNWVWFDILSEKLNRVDDGSLVVVNDKPLLPSDRIVMDKLEVIVPKEIELYSQKTIIIEANISNLAGGPSYWIACYSEDENILVYTNQIMRLDPKEHKTLKIKLASALPNKNLEPFGKEVELKFMTANGEYESKTIKVNFKTPKLEIIEAKYNSEDKSLLVEIINSGDESINDLDIKIGKEIQRIDKLESNKSIKKSFVIANPPDDVNLSIYKPFYEWELQSPVTVRDMFVYYIILAVLIVGLVIAIYYHRRYRHPLLVKLEQNNNALSSLSLDELEETIALLKNIGRLDNVLKINHLSSEKLDKVIAFTHAQDDLSERFVDISKLKTNGDKILFPLDFELDIENIKLDSSGDGEKLKTSTEKVLAISNNREIQESLSSIAKDKTNLVVAPNYQQLSKMLLSPSIYPELVELFSNTLNLKDISPYQIASDVKKENMFFGRVEIISNIINRNAHNYIIVGARQLGKSSLLKALDRRYQERNMLSYYITLDKESDLVYHLSKVLAVQNDIKSIQEAIYQSEQPIIFLIDEVDEFLKRSENSAKFTSIFRSLAQGDRAYFILAGYWELYKETLKAKSPLRNFGDIITLGGLEKEACRELITKPMKSMGVSYTSTETVEKIIHKTGQRSNLVSVVCDRLVSIVKNKRICQENLEQVLSSGFTEYISMPEEKLDRVIVYATITKESFYQEELYDVFDRFDLNIDSREIEESLFRLELSFVIVKVDGQYRYRVPLFVDKVKEGIKSFEKMLAREVEELKRAR